MSKHMVGIRRHVLYHPRDTGMVWIQMNCLTSMSVIYEPKFDVLFTVIAVSMLYTITKLTGSTKLELYC